MQKQAGISVSCGTIYSKMYDQMWYSSLDHSVAVALIIWNFTKDKKQTLSGLFHDIATPVFKHCIDFMNGDSEKQESIEERTYDIIKNSKEIMSLLERDNIKLEEINDYHIYPIADNDTPMLSSDRLEYTLSNALGSVEKIWGLKEIEEIYKNIEIQKNEDGIQELGFKNLEIAEKFVHTMSILSRLYRREKTIFSMQLLADIMKKMSVQNMITINDLYKLSEKEIISKIENCNDENLELEMEVVAFKGKAAEVFELPSGLYRVIFIPSWSWRYGEEVKYNVIENAVEKDQVIGSYVDINVLSGQFTDIKTSYDMQNKLWLSKSFIEKYTKNPI